MGEMSTAATNPSHQLPPPVFAMNDISRIEVANLEGPDGANGKANGVGILLGSGSIGSGQTSNSDHEVVGVRKKRGRPRKYNAEENGVSLACHPPPLPPLAIMVSPSPGNCEKRARGRPRGSGKLQLLSSLAETAGGSFTPHVLTVQTGQDIVSKILSFPQKGRPIICILSAIGPVSSVTLCQANSSGGMLRYEGRFEILSLSGSFTCDRTGGGNGKTGGLSVSLAKSDGRVFGGGIARSLIAAGPIQLIIASFKQSISMELNIKQSAESSSATPSAAAKLAVVADGHQNCRTPTSAPSEPQNAEAVDNSVNLDQYVNLAPQNDELRNELTSSPEEPSSLGRGTSTMSVSPRTR